MLLGESVTLRLELAGEGLGSEQDRFHVQRAVYSLLAELIVATRPGEALRPEDLAELDSRPRLLTPAVQSAGPGRTPPRGFDQAVPGIMVMFLLMTMLITGASGWSWSGAKASYVAWRRRRSVQARSSQAKRRPAGVWACSRRRSR